MNLNTMCHILTGYKASRNHGDDKEHYSWITQRASGSIYRYEEPITQRASSFTYWYHEEPNRKRELVR